MAWPKAAHRALVGLAAAAVLSGVLPTSGSVLAAPSGGHDQRARATGLLRPCRFDRSVRCGSVQVPMDRRAPQSGRIRIAYELYRRRDRSRPLLGTIVAVEGGPGYSTTGSRNYYLDLFGPLLDRRRLLLVDNRGTGKSQPILCQPLQSYRGNYVRAVGRCGRQLGSTSDLYGVPWRLRTWSRCSTASASPGSTCTATPTARSSRRRLPCDTPTGCAR